MAPNALAYAMLLVWPLVSLFFFRKLGPSRGLLFCIIGGYLLLPPDPAGFNLPILPTLNKENIPAFSALLIYLRYYRRQFAIIPDSRVVRVLLLMLLASSVLTSWSNQDPVFWGSFMVRGTSLLDSVSLVIGSVGRVAPFLLARAIISGDDDQRTMHWALFVGVIAYSFPMLLEVLLSPQLNVWIYGYFQHEFGQMMRGGGFRPIVFLYHGLWVAFLAAWGIMVAVSLFRNGGQGALAAGLGALWLVGVLVLCKSMASLIYAMLGSVLLLFAPVWLLVRLTAIATLVMLVFPTLRQAGYVPTQRLVEIAEGFSAERAFSLEFRFDNEDILLERALERPLFGWGGYGRHAILEEDTGRFLSTSDGLWVILLGGSGWFGYIAFIGLLTIPNLMIWWRGGPTPPLLVASGMVLLATNVIDLIPNATATPLTWLVSGALLGWAERKAPVDEPVHPQRSTSFPVVIGSREGQGIRTIL